MLKKILTISLLLSFLTTLLPPLSIPVAKAAVTPPAFSLYPTSGDYYEACETIDVDILIHTNNTNTDSANIIIGYDDTKVEVQDDDGGVGGIQITTGSSYDNHASYTVDEDDDEILLTGYNTVSPFNSGASYTTFGSFTLNPQSTGTANLTIDFTPGETVDSNIAEAVTSDDILNAVENASYNLLADSTAPYTSDLNPANSASGVAISSNVVLRFKDDECGADIDTLTVTVDGTAYTKAGPNTFSYSGTSSNYLITINPASNFGYDETINVSVAADDIEGNPLTQAYSFTTIADTTDPTISNRNPASGATNILKNTNVGFRVSDTETGVDIDTVSATVDGVVYTKAGPNTFSYTGTTAAYDITINPASDFTKGATINVAIDADDLANTPNSMSTVNYSFSLDSTPPTISGRNPANSATNILKSTNVVFTISDANTNVDLSTVSATVDSVEYTESGPNTFSYTGSGSSYEITVNPASDFTTGATINVSI
ncbi:hypothetical protein HOM98_03630, partial [Candidatus Peregrinibacteria bacterium]|nr:hypothetical protein [Candidatus Peregrinibacteria bacterium]